MNIGMELAMQWETCENYSFKTKDRISGQAQLPH